MQENVLLFKYVLNLLGYIRIEKLKNGQVMG